MEKTRFRGYGWAALAAVLVACQTVPMTGRQQMMLVGEGEEVQMGLTAFQEVLQKEKISHDPRLNDMVTRVGRRIAAATGRTDYQWEFKVIENDKMVNAFCLPGGKVAVYTGMIPVARDEAGLAAVIGHEVAHAIARHGGERMSQQMAAQGVTSAVAIGVGASGGSSKANLYAGLLGAGLSVGLLLPYSRLQESEADHMGLNYMAKAGYHPAAARDLWVRMSQGAQGKPPEFLSTHPADQTRIRQIESWLPEAMKYYRPR